MAERDPMRWSWRLDVSPYWTTSDDDADVREAMPKIAARLRQEHDDTYPDDYELLEIVEELEGTAEDGDIDAFNYAWETFYDWADAHGVWVITREGVIDNED
jgi:hypothetical protein